MKQITLSVQLGNLLLPLFTGGDATEKYTDGREDGDDDSRENLHSRGKLSHTVGLGLQQMDEVVAHARGDHNEIFGKSRDEAENKMNEGGDQHEEKGFLGIRLGGVVIPPIEEEQEYGRGEKDNDRGGTTLCHSEGVQVVNVSP